MRAHELDSCPGRDHLERWARNVHPDDLFDFQRKLVDVRTGASDAFECEYRILTYDSRWLWVLHRGHMLEHTLDGKPFRVCGVCIEIDVRKQAEVALQENEARLATALWGARAAFWQWQIAANAVMMSPLWFAMTGYTREQWEESTDPWFSRIHADDRESVELQMRAHLSGEHPAIDINLGSAPVTVAGSGCSRAVTPWPGTSTAIPRWRSAYPSTSTRARNSSSVRAVAGEMQFFILETMREGVMLRGRRQHDPPQIRPSIRVFGYESGGLLGQPVEPLLACARASAGISSSLSAKVTIERAPCEPVEFECMRKDGSRFVASCVITPLSMGSRSLARRGQRRHERNASSAEIIEIANREQQRIGSDLHDGLGQELTGIALMLRGSRRSSTRRGLPRRSDMEEVIGLVNNAIESTRTLARGLSPVSRRARRSRCRAAGARRSAGASGMASV